jgi:hypothetical protein
VASHEGEKTTESAQQLAYRVPGGSCGNRRWVSPDMSALIRRFDYFQRALGSLRQQIQHYLFFMKLQMTQGSPTKITQSEPSNLVNANFLDKTKRINGI